MTFVTGKSFPFDRHELRPDFQLFKDHERYYDDDRRQSSKAVREPTI
jgi:hypothetical protein